MQIVLWKPPGDFVRNLINTNSSTSGHSHQPCSDDDDEDDDVMTDDVMTDVTDSQQQSCMTSPIAADDMDL